VRLIPETDKIGGMWPPSGLILDKSDCDLFNEIHFLIMFKVKCLRRRFTKYK